MAISEKMCTVNPSVRQKCASSLKGTQRGHRLLGEFLAKYAYDYVRRRLPRLHPTSFHRAAARATASLRLAEIQNDMYLLVTVTVWFLAKSKPYQYTTDPTSLYIVPT